ncbi:MAG: hypothetical protein R6W82_06715 [bacterium]
MSAARTARYGVLSLFLLTAGCGEQEGRGPATLSVLSLYEEPADSVDPGLVMVRDLLPLGDRIYVLDGRLVHVAVMTPRGEVTGRFGGPGEGPGELGRYPWALVTDGGRVGVVSLLHVSWFTPEGVFLEREQLPAADLMNPSIHYSDGWAANAPFRGEGGPLAVYAPARGDTLMLGTAAMPDGNAPRSPAASELNAVQVVRFDSGAFLLAHQQRNLIEVRGPDGRVRTSHRWEHLSDELPRRPEGTLSGMPGYTFSAECWDGETAVLVDGTARRVLEIGSDGERRGLYRSGEGVMWAGRTREGRLLAAGGPDRVVELRPGPGGGPPPPVRGSEESAGSAPSLTRLLSSPAAALGGEGIHRARGGGRDARPSALEMALGDSLLFLGYGDGLGLLLALDDSLALRGVLQPVDRSSLTSVHIAAGRVYAADYEEGITPLHPRGETVPLPEAMRYRGLVPLTHDRWLVVARRGGWRLYLWETDRGSMTEQARLEGRDGPGVEAVPLAGGRAALVDRDRLELAVWSPGRPLTWRPIRGTGFERARRNLFGVPAADVEGAALFGRGDDLLLWASDFDGERSENWIERVGLDGVVKGRWKVPLRWSLRSAAGREGEVYLLTNEGVDVWRLEDTPPVAAPGDLRGLDLRERLGPLYDLQGQAAVPAAAETEVWVVVEEQECASCLFRLPETARRVGRVGEGRVGLALVATGDRLEARRALLGMEMGMPVFSAPQSRLTAGGRSLDTPMTFITRHGRVTASVPWSDPGDRPLAERTVEALLPWLPAAQDRQLSPLPLLRSRE